MRIVIIICLLQALLLAPDDALAQQVLSFSDKTDFKPQNQTANTSFWEMYQPTTAGSVVSPVTQATVPPSKKRLVDLWSVLPQSNPTESGESPNRVQQPSDPVVATGIATRDFWNQLNPLADCTPPTGEGLPHRSSASGAPCVNGSQPSKTQSFTLHPWPAALQTNKLMLQLDAHEGQDVTEPKASPTSTAQYEPVLDHDAAWESWDKAPASIVSQAGGSNRVEKVVEAPSTSPVAPAEQILELPKPTPEPTFLSFSDREDLTVTAEAKSGLSSRPPRLAKQQDNSTPSSTSRVAKNFQIAPTEQPSAEWSKVTTIVVEESLPVDSSTLPQRTFKQFSGEEVSHRKLRGLIASEVAFESASSNDRDVEELIRSTSFVRPLDDEAMSETSPSDLDATYSSSLVATTSQEEVADVQPLLSTAAMIGPPSEATTLFSRLDITDTLQQVAIYDYSIVRKGVQNSDWLPAAYRWISPAFHHHPLYFEQPNLERYGQGRSRILQPALSATHFFASIPLIPYKSFKHHPRELQYTLGRGRPGNRTAVRKKVLTGESTFGECLLFWGDNSGYRKAKSRR